MTRPIPGSEAAQTAEAAHARAEEVATLAVKTLEELAADQSQPSSIRVDAALGLLVHYRHYYDG